MFGALQLRIPFFLDTKAFSLDSRNPTFRDKVVSSSRFKISKATWPLRHYFASKHLILITQWLSMRSHKKEILTFGAAEFSYYLSESEHVFFCTSKMHCRIMEVQDFVWSILLALVKVLSPINPVRLTSLVDSPRRMEQRRVGTRSECPVKSMVGH